MASKPLAIIGGVGPGTGASVARKFARSYAVVLLARNPANYESLVKEINSSGGKAVGISTDISSASSIHSAFEKIKSEMGKTGVAAAVFNVSGGFVKKPFLQLNLEEFESGFEANCKGAFLFSQAVLPLLLSTVDAKPEHPPTLIFTGATASVKSSATSATFASGKFALRALSQSLAREFGPQGIHVSHAIIDGVIDLERTKNWVLSDKPDAKISPDARHVLNMADLLRRPDEPRNASAGDIKSESASTGLKLVAGSKL
ncbi:MAG: hypothetical protein M1834_004211 [Cirrosporium novae-zelandiae]|nr:MAG: hypothetical protein M1834_004211 [Cirrosporium novae-zelandiae]